MGRHPVVGIVTVTYNSERVLEDFLGSIISQCYTDFKLYLVDNASSDGTLDYLKNVSDDRIEIIKNATNLGVAEGNNQGIRAALADGCRFVLLINNDTVFGATLLGDMLSEIDSYGCEMVVPKMFFHDDPNRIWCAGGAFRRMRGYASLHFGEGELDKGQFSVSRTIEYCPTCCTLIRAVVFEKIGMMDSKYFVYWDDTDFCYRAMKHGLRMVYSPSIKLWHKVSSLTGGKVSLFSQYYGTRNKVYFLLKHRPVAEVILHLWVYWIYLLLLPVVGKADFDMFKARQRGFFDGIKLKFCEEI